MISNCVCMFACVIACVCECVCVHVYDCMCLCEYLHVCVDVLCLHVCIVAASPAAHYMMNKSGESGDGEVLYLQPYQQ